MPKATCCKSAADAKSIFHDRRSILRTRKRMESVRPKGGAFARETGTCGLKAVQPGGNPVHAWVKVGVFPPTALMPALPIQKSRASNAKWEHESVAASPSGVDSQHTWQGLPHPSGSSAQRQTVCPQQIAASAVQHAAAIATQSFSLLLPFTRRIISRIFWFRNFK